jgi:hypothetical protein
LKDLKSPPPPSDEVSKRDANVSVDDLGVPLRRVVISKDVHRADDLYTRRVRRDDDDTLLDVSILVARIRFANDEMNSTSNIYCA